MTKTFLWCILEADADRKAFFIFGRKRKCRRIWNFIYGRKQNENVNGHSFSADKRKRKSTDNVFIFFFKHLVTKSALQCTTNTSSSFAFFAGWSLNYIRCLLTVNRCRVQHSSDVVYFQRLYLSDALEASKADSITGQLDSALIQAASPHSSGALQNVLRPAHAAKQSLQWSTPTGIKGSQIMRRMEKSLAPISSLAVPAHGMIFVATIKCVLSANWIVHTNDYSQALFPTWCALHPWNIFCLQTAYMSTLMITYGVSFRRCHGNAETADIGYRNRLLRRWNWYNCLPLRLNVYRTFLQQIFQRLINIQQVSMYFICTVINNTIRHFDIKDRTGCRKAVRAITAGCFHPSNNWQFITGARNEIHKQKSK